MSGQRAQVIVLIGASSAVAKKFLTLIDKTQIKIISVSREESEHCNPHHITITNYLDSYLQVKLSEILSNYDSVMFIFFNGKKDNELFISSSESENRNIFEVNYFIPTLVTKNLIKNMISKTMSFVYLSSFRAHNAGRGSSGYGASKIALESFAKSMAAEMTRINKFFYVIGIGIINDGMIDSVPQGLQEELLQRTNTGDFAEVEVLVDYIMSLHTNKLLSGSNINMSDGLF